MFLAHLPAGYLAAAGAQRLGFRFRGLMASSLAGSLAPDADLLYTYIVDGGRVHHHLYPTHFPSLWLACLLLSLLALCCTRGKARWAMGAAFFCASALIHLALDAVAGDVPLLAPWSMRFFSLVTVEARYSPWWLNFVLHETMLLELALCSAATIILLRRRRRPRPGRA